jgi:lysophospholipase L1-like esterase
VRTLRIALGSAATIGLLWWLTAGEDRDTALWRHYTGPVAALNLGATALVVAVAYVAAGTRDCRRVRCFRAILVGGSALVGLMILEVPAVFGHDYRQTLGTSENDEWLQIAMGFNRYDPELLHVHQPHSQFKGVVAGNLVWRLGIPAPQMYPVDIRYDKNGFRNDEDLVRADVAALGDSFVEAAEVPLAQTVSARLAVRLEAVVANLGQSGYGPQQELVVLERYGIPLSPKLVVWFLFGGNDLGDSEGYEKSRQLYEAALAPAPWFARSFERNALKALARLTTVPRSEPTPVARRHAARFTAATGTEVLYFDAPEGPWRPGQLEVVCDTLLRAREVTRQMGADFLLVYVPRKLRVYKGFVELDADSVAHGWPLNRLPDVLREWSQEQELDFLDSTVALRAAVASGRSVYLPDDVHWNPAGHDVVAAAIADYVRKKHGRTR